MVPKIICKIALAFMSFYSLVVLVEGLVFWRLRMTAFIALTVIWLVPLVALETFLLWRNKNPFPRLLTHLRFAPLAIMFFSIVVTIAFDAAMVQYSKYQIRDYVYGDAPPENEFRLKLHNTYRGWCGNGYSANEYRLYAETAAEGFSSADPKVRARSLRISIQTYDWLNGVEKDSPFSKLIKQAAQDEDLLVRQMAEDF